MSIGTALTSIGAFLSGPIMTGISNVATLGTLGVSIATKVDTHNIKSTVGGLKSDIAVLDRDILSLAGDISDMRQERYWSLALAGEKPVAVTGGGNPTLVQLAGMPQAQPVQQPVQLQPAPQPQPTVPVQPAQPVQPQSAPQSQFITRDELNNAFTNMAGSIPTIVGQAVQQAVKAAMSEQTEPSGAKPEEAKT